MVEQLRQSTGGARPWMMLVRSLRRRSPSRESRTRPGSTRPLAKKGGLGLRTAGSTRCTVERGTPASARLRGHGRPRNLPSNVYRTVCSTVGDLQQRPRACFQLVLPILWPKRSLATLAGPTDFEMIDPWPAPDQNRPILALSRDNNPWSEACRGGPPAAIAIADRESSERALGWRRRCF